MAILSDLIENFIKELINETEGNVEIKRNELASKFNCVPSQINYVIGTRFTQERGYYVESRRGGGGHIRIMLRLFSYNVTPPKLCHKPKDTAGSFKPLFPQ
jgi:transcriptional regulator CtsR